VSATLTLPNCQRAQRAQGEPETIILDVALGQAIGKKDSGRWTIGLLLKGQTPLREFFGGPYSKSAGAVIMDTLIPAIALRFGLPLNDC
jgi:hypothetical protein